ncbi:hypothetical protein V6M80_09880, partial [Enterococcus faecium]|uniref:hypothetical protein n=1 Tax=Enterococcus faecium TaxID=1352 RepID=UPI002FF209B2
KDWTQRASDARWSEAFDANANAAESARAADAALGYNNQDWTKSAKGFQNAASALQDRDFLKKYGVKAEDWKRDQDAAASDFAAQKASLWDTDAERNAIDARSFAAAA